MPVDYLQIQAQIRDFGNKARLREEKLKSMLHQGQDLLDQYAGDPDFLSRRVERGLAFNPNLRCAAPAGEKLNERYPLPQDVPHATLLAADGSQINPDRHAKVEFCVINVGALHLQAGSGQPPQVFTRSRLLDYDELVTDNGLITEGAVALKRDLSERQVLVELARGAPPPVITLTDGPLELYREPRPSPEFDRALEDYLGVLRELAGTGASTAGYVDRPRSDLVVRMLELALLKEYELDQSGRQRELRSLSDAGLFRERLREPGDRSAVFAIQSPAAQKFGGELALHFFYMNVGRPNSPYLARVEIPAWVAENPEAVNSLQAALFAQCRLMGARPYPYVLHRAHETAEVTFQEKGRLEELLAAELQRQGLGLADKSNKQSAKDGAKRTRMKP